MKISMRFSQGSVACLLGGQTQFSDSCHSRIPTVVAEAKHEHSSLIQGSKRQKGFAHLEARQTVVVLFQRLNGQRLIAVGGIDSVGVLLQNEACTHMSCLMRGGLMLHDGHHIGAKSSCSFYFISQRVRDSNPSTVCAPSQLPLPK